MCLCAGRLLVEPAVADTPDREEETVVRYDRVKQHFEIDFENASAKDIRYRCGPMTLSKGKLKQIVPFALNQNDCLEMDVFIDRSVIEIFVNSRICLVQRVYPTRNDSTQFRLFTEDGTVEASELHKWEMDATNPW